MCKSSTLYLRKSRSLEDYELSFDVLDENIMADWNKEEQIMHVSKLTTKFFGLKIPQGETRISVANS